MEKTLRYSLLACCMCLLAACDLAYDPQGGGGPPAENESAVAPPPTAADAAAFVAAAEQRLAELGQHNERMAWVLANFITADSELLAARTAGDFTAAQVEIAGQVASFKDVTGLDDDTRRKLDMLRSGIVMPAPSDPAAP